MKWTRYMSYDTETTGLDIYRGDRMFAFSIGNEDGATEVYRLDGSALRVHRGERMLRKFWADTRVEKTIHNALFDIPVTQHYGIKIPDRTRYHCTMTMSHLLQNWHRSHALKDLCWELGGFPIEDEKAVKKHARKGDYSKVPEHLMDTYQHGDAERGMLLFKLWYPGIRANHILLDIYNSEMDVIRTTVRMQERGVMVDPAKVAKLLEWLEGEATDALRALHKANGEPFNPDSPDQLVEFLFSKLGLPVLKRTPKTKQPSTEKEVMLELAESYPHPSLDLVIKYRSYTRGQAIVSGYLDYCDEHNIIHPSIRTNGAQTGRESCSRPNLQNVAKEGVLKNKYPVPARRCFRPKPGLINYHFDYAGIEMRLLVHYSRDPKMTAAFQRGDDPHELAARILYGKRFKDEKDKGKRREMRDAAKNTNYAIHYGSGVANTAAVLNLPMAEVKPRLALYHSEFPGARELPRWTKNEVTEKGYVTTTFGRQLGVNRSKPYMATNYLIQGTAAEVLKRAQVKVDAYLRKVTKDAAGIILPVHDELVIEVPRTLMAEIPKLLRGIKACMIDFKQFRVPMDVECKRTTSDWAHTKAVELD